MGVLRSGGLNMPRYHTLWDAATRSVKDIPFTPDEEKTRNAEESQYLQDMETAKKAESTRANARASAIAKLEKLGLSVLEIEAVFFD